VGADGSELVGLEIVSANNVDLYGSVFTDGGLDFTNVTRTNVQNNLALYTDSDQGAIVFDADSSLEGPFGVVIETGGGPVTLFDAGQNDNLKFLSVNPTTPGALSLKGNIAMGIPTGADSILLNVTTLVQDDKIIDSPDGDIRITGSGDIQIGHLNAAGNTVDITTGGNILNNNTTNTNVTADTFTASADKYIGRVNGGNVFNDPAVGTPETIATDVTTLNLTLNSGSAEIAVDNNNAAETDLNITLTGATGTDLIWVRNQGGGLDATGVDLNVDGNDVALISGLGATSALTITDGGGDTAGDDIDMPSSKLRLEGRGTLGVVDGDTTLGIRVDELVFASGATQTLFTEVNSFDGEMLDVTGGKANLTLTEVDSLAIEDLNSDGNALIVNDGNLTVTVSESNLTIDDIVQVTDNTDDGTRDGLLDIQITGSADAGNMILGGQRSTTVASVNLVDDDELGGLVDGDFPTDKLALRLRIGTENDIERDISIGENNSTIVSVDGGDMFIDAATATDSGSRDVILGTQSELFALTQGLHDGLTGFIEIGSVIQQGDVRRKSDRTIQVRGFGENIRINTPRTYVGEHILDGGGQNIIMETGGFLYVEQGHDGLGGGDPESQGPGSISIINAQSFTMTDGYIKTHGSVKIGGSGAPGEKITGGVTLLDVTVDADGDGLSQYTENQSDPSLWAGSAQAEVTPNSVASLEVYAEGAITLSGTIDVNATAANQNTVTLVSGENIVDGNGTADNFADFAPTDVTDGTGVIVGDPTNILQIAVADTFTTVDGNNPVHTLTMRAATGIGNTDVLEVDAAVLDAINDHTTVNGLLTMLLTDTSGDIQIVSDPSAPTDVGEATNELQITGLLNSGGAIDYDQSSAFYKDVLLASDVTSGSPLTLDVGTGTLTLSGADRTLSSSGGTGTISVTADTIANDGTARILTVTGGTGDLVINAKLGANGDELAGVDITSAGTVQFNDTIDVNDLKVGSGSDVTDVQFTSAANVGSGGVDINTGTLTLANTLTTTSGGAVTITNAGQLTILDAANMTLDGAFTVDGDGPVITQGDITMTSAKDIIFDGAGAVTIGVNDVAFNSSGGNIRFDGDVTGAGLLTLTAGGGNIDFKSTIGSAGALSGLTVHRQHRHHDQRGCGNHHQRGAADN
jgi:hypothetical protein